MSTRGEQTTYDARLAAFVGASLHDLAAGQDPVNVPMIRHWVEAMELTNPVHLDRAAAVESGRSDVVAPASMIQAWIMRGYARTVRPGAAGGAHAELVELLDEGGYTSVVATDSDLEFVREVHPGEEILTDEVVEDISPEKQTGLGAGRFVTTLKTYYARPAGDTGGGEVVATQRWRTLRFEPKEETESRALRPRPAINPDNRFWFDAAAEHRLVIQRCGDCGTLRHPPGPQCGHCQSFDSDTVDASGHATLYSFTVAHHPKHPAFDYPLVVAVVELEEGTRLITNLVGIEADAVEIGMPLVLDWLDADPDLTLPVFRPATPPEER